MAAWSEQTVVPQETIKATKIPRWSNKQLQHLIEKYKVRPCLWDIAREDYHSREATGKAKRELEVNGICFQSV